MHLATLLSSVHALWTVPVSLMARMRQPSLDMSQYEVHSLPELPKDSPLPTSWAGRLPVPDVEEGNSLFFWLFETEDSAYDDNLISKMKLLSDPSSENGSQGIQYGSTAALAVRLWQD